VNCYNIYVPRFWYDRGASTSLFPFKYATAVDVERNGFTIGERNRVPQKASSPQNCIIDRSHFITQKESFDTTITSTLFVPKIIETFEIQVSET
jgi:hypothetical protein